jgi:hypothetical protein
VGFPSRFRRLVANTRIAAASAGGNCIGSSFRPRRSRRAFRPLLQSSRKSPKLGAHACLASSQRLDHYCAGWAAGDPLGTPSYEGTARHCYCSDSTGCTDSLRGNPELLRPTMSATGPRSRHRPRPRPSWPRMLFFSSRMRLCTGRADERTQPNHGLYLGGCPLACQKSLPWNWVRIVLAE